MGSFFRFFFAAPVAFIVTLLIFLGLYNQLSPKPILYTSSEQPEAVFLGDQIICECGPFIREHIFWVIPEIEVENQWTESEKAAQEPPTQTPSKPSVSIDVPSYSGNTLELGKMGHPTQMFSYPKECIDKGVEGVVTAQFDITPEGRVTNIKIISSPDECFHSAIISYLSRWRYHPPEDGEGRPTWRRGETTTFTFVLTEG